MCVYFQLLQQCTDPVTEDEEEALAINRGRQDKNRSGADIPGIGVHVGYKAIMIVNVYVCVMMSLIAYKIYQ